MVDPSSPVTKAELAEQLGALEERLEKRLEKRFDERLDERLGAINEQLQMQRAEMQHQYDTLKEMIRDSQTEILKAFYGYTQTVDVKLRESELSDVALRQRLTAIEARVLELEKRLNLPPAAQPLGPLAYGRGPQKHSEN